MVRDNREGVGVRLGEHILSVDLLEHLQCGIIVHPIALSAFEEVPPVYLKQVSVIGFGEGAPHGVRLGRAHAANVHDKLNHLLLPDDYAVAALEGALLKRMVVLSGLPIPVSIVEPTHRALGGAHAGPNQRDLVGEVQKIPRAQPSRQL